MSCCTVERHFLVTHGTMNLESGGVSQDSQEWVTGPCNAPLFSDNTRALGVCNSCLKGWEVETNTLTDKGRETVAAARVE